MGSMQGSPCILGGPMLRCRGLRVWVRSSCFERLRSLRKLSHRTQDKLLTHGQGKGLQVLADSVARFSNYGQVNSDRHTGH